MNGPEHYREAERLLGQVRQGYETGPTMSYEHETAALAEAQVHATFALAAATASSSPSSATQQEWTGALA